MRRRDTLVYSLRIQSVETLIVGARTCQKGKTGPKNSNKNLTPWRVLERQVKRESVTRRQGSSSLEIESYFQMKKTKKKNKKEKNRDS